MKPLPNAALLPVTQSSPTRHAASAAHFPGKLAPLDPRLEHEHDPRERSAVVHARATSLWLRRLRRKQLLHLRPQRVRDQLRLHGQRLRHELVRYHPDRELRCGFETITYRLLMLPPWRRRANILRNISRIALVDQAWVTEASLPMGFSIFVHFQENIRRYTNTGKPIAWFNQK